MHILQTESLRSRLSEKEMDYANKYSNIIEDHCNNTILSALPESLRTLTEQSADFDMSMFMPHPRTDRRSNCTGQAKGITPLGIPNERSKCLLTSPLMYSYHLNLAREQFP